MQEVKSINQVMSYHLNNKRLSQTIVLKYDVRDDILARVERQCELQKWDIKDCSLILELPDFMD